MSKERKIKVVIGCDGGMSVDANELFATPKVRQIIKDFAQYGIAKKKQQWYNA